MAIMFAYIVGESLVLLLGFGCWILLALSPGINNGPVSLILVACAALGIALGIFFAWLALQFFPAQVWKKAPWLWLGSLVSGLLIGGLGLLLKPGEAENATITAGLAATFGTLPGLGLALLLTRSLAPQNSGSNVLAAVAQPSTPLPRFVATDEEEEGIPDIASGPVTAGPRDLRQARKRLYRELRDLAKENPEARGELRIMEDQRLTAIVTMRSYLGQVTFYIVCDPAYPRSAPEEVFIEVSDQQRNRGRPLNFDYDQRLLTKWNTGSNLSTIIQDGFLQIEEILIR